MSSTYWLVEEVDQMTTMPSGFKLFMSENPARRWIEDNYGPGEFNDGWVGLTFTPDDDDDVVAVLHKVELMEDE